MQELTVVGTVLGGSDKPRLRLLDMNQFTKSKSGQCELELNPIRAFMHEVFAVNS